MRANICTYFKNGSPLASSAQNIDILSGSNRSALRFDGVAAGLLSGQPNKFGLFVKKIIGWLRNF